jgi:hypothetical protein
MSEYAFHHVLPKRDGCSTHFATCVVLDVIPIDLEFRMIVHVNHFMYNRVFHVFLVKEPILAEHDSIVWMESASTLLMTRLAHQMVGRHITVDQP